MAPRCSKKQGAEVPAAQQPPNAYFNLTGIVKRVPQINKSGNAQEDNRRTMVRGGFIKLLELFIEDPDRILSTLNTVQMGMVNIAQEDPKEYLRWPNTYTKIGRLPKYWKAAFLTELSNTKCRGTC